MAKFKPGQSGNPGGRPALLKGVQALARERTEDSVRALLQALKVPGERVAAATILLAYGYGRPVQTMNLRRIREIGDLDEEELVALAGTKEAPSDGTRH